jgi:hypothetical protein
MINVGSDVETPTPACPVECIDVSELRQLTAVGYMVILIMSINMR